LERYLRVNLLGPGPRLMKKNLPGRGLTKVEKHCPRLLIVMASFTGNSEEEAVFEDVTDEPYKTNEFSFKSLLHVKYSTVNHVITTRWSIVQDRALQVSIAIINFI